jgi:acetoin utilization protein AcuB
MLVGERMTTSVVTIQPEMPIQEALLIMRNKSIRRLPVVDGDENLVGLVSLLDLINASPSDATTLSVWELNYLISKITVKEIMTEAVITVSEDTPVEEAAKIMADNKIGGMPVLKDKRVVGIITETDLFKIFLEMLGGRRSGVRVTIQVPDVPGELASLTGALRDAGGNIISLGTFQGESPETSIITFKVEGIELTDVRRTIEPFIENIIDIRMT